MSEPPAKSDKREYPPVLEKPIYWIGGLVALLTVLSAASDEGHKLWGSLENWGITKLFKSAECSGDMTWEQRQKCDQHR